MNYYDEILSEIKDLLAGNDYVNATSLIDEELSMPYIPREYADELAKLKERIVQSTSDIGQLSLEKLEKYLFQDEYHQLLAVDQLNKMNLRDHLELIQQYFNCDPFVNAAVLLIESLIAQEIKEEITYQRDGLSYRFIPRYLLLPSESDGYLVAVGKMEDLYLHEPAKLIMAKDLLYKECLLYLPLNYDEDEGILLADKIYEYIESCFQDGETL